MEKQTQELSKSGINMREIRNTDMSALMWWCAKDYLDGEMKRRLSLQDKARSVDHETTDHDRVHDRT